MRDERPLEIGIAAAVAAIFITELFWQFAPPDKFVNWTGTIIAAAISAILAIAIGLFLFNRNTEEANTRKREQLLALLARL